MTWPRYEAMQAQWRQVPPLSVSVSLIAQALGAKTTSAAPAPQQPQRRSGHDEHATKRQALIDLLGGVPGFSVGSAR